MGCGTSCRVGKISILRHFLVKRKDVDSSRTYCEGKMTCCSMVLIWAETQLQKLRWATGADESSSLHSFTGVPWSSRCARADHRFLSSICVGACCIEPLSVVREMWRTHQVVHKGTSTISDPFRREHLKKSFLQALLREGQSFRDGIPKEGSNRQDRCQQRCRNQRCSLLP